MSPIEHQFEADTGKVLNIVINSLYSNKEIFLRELISNSSDACDKRRYKGQTNKSLATSDELSIEIKVDSKSKDLVVNAKAISNLSTSFPNKDDHWFSINQSCTL